MLAPDNTAFETLRASVGGEELLDDPDRLRPLLQRHVILQPLTLAQLFALDEVESSEGEILTIDGEAETIEGAEVIPDGGDRDTPNGGFLHAIDLVIV